MASSPSCLQVRPWGFGPKFWQLLPPAERALFRRLAVFVGGWTLEAAEAVCQAAGVLDLDLIEGLATLLDKSLLRVEQVPDGAKRFRMLHVLREFALECLIDAGEVEATRLAYTRYFAQFAERLAVEQPVPQDEHRRLARLEAESENLRAALLWLIEQGELGQQSMELALRLGGALERYWLPRGFGQEELDLLLRALKQPEGVPHTVLAQALYCAGHLALHSGQTALLQTLGQHLLDRSRAQGDKRGMAHACYLFGSDATFVLGHAAARPHTSPAQALAFHQEALRLWRELGDTQESAWALFHLARVALFGKGHAAQALTWLEEGLPPHKYRFLRKKKEKAGQAQPCYADENIFPISSAAGGREWLAHSDYQRGSRRCQARLPT